MTVQAPEAQLDVASESPHAEMSRNYLFKKRKESFSR